MLQLINHTCAKCAISKETHAMYCTVYSTNQHTNVLLNLSNRALLFIDQNEIMINLLNPFQNTCK